MTSGGDWNPGDYARFRDLRLQPALDLLARVPDLPPGDVIDLGCGEGAALAALRQAYPGRTIRGIDASASMLAAAGPYDSLCRTGIADWHPETPPALIFSNAVLHWLGDHDRLFPRLAALPAPGGTLALQMPRQYLAPSHALMRTLADRMFPDLFDHRDWRPPVLEPAAYLGLLAPFGRVTIWETIYHQRLEPAHEGHPVRAFTASTALRPFAARLTPAQSRDFIAAYDQALEKAYPPGPDGACLFPFQRLFILVTR